jgi:hypothetical protein
MRDLSDREDQNILDLEAEEALERALADLSNPVSPEPLSSEPAPGVSPGSAGFSLTLFGLVSRTPLVPFGNPLGS